MTAPTPPEAEPSPQSRSIHALHYQNFVSDASNFHPRDGHHILEVTAPADGSGDGVLDEKEVLESAIAPWALRAASDAQAGSSATQPRFRMLYLSQLPSSGLD